MDASTLFKSKYFKAADLVGKRISATIESAEVETLRDGSEKLVIYFKGREQGLIANKTNFNILAGAYGHETDAWPGQDVVLFAEKVSFQGTATNGIRIDPVAKKNPAQKATAPDLDTSSDTPF